MSTEYRGTAVSDPAKATQQTLPGPARTSNPNRVLHILQERIEQRTYPPGGWLPTERELAQELEVNRSAVRDALRRLEHGGLIERRPGCRPIVRPAVRESAIRVPAVSAPRVIAVAMPQHEADHASREIVRGIGSVLRSGETCDRQLLFDVVMQMREPHVTEQEVCDALEAGEAVAAIVWSTLHPQALERWQALRGRGYPVVFVDRHDSEMFCDYVGVDNYLAAREAVEYLQELGHTRIAHLTSSEPVSAVLERAAGYRDAMEAAGLALDTVTWTVPYRAVVQTESVIRQGIDTYGLPTAVFCVNDHAAYRCIECLEASDIRVPDQVSVVGFDDIDRFSPRAGFLTSVRQPFERIGQRAAALLMKRLSETSATAAPYQHILVPTRLIERQSSRSIKSS